MYGEIGAVQQAAASKAGGWKALFAARHAALKEAEPWHKPCAFEVQASGGACGAAVGYWEVAMAVWGALLQPLLLCQPAALRAAPWPGGRV